MTSLTSLSRHFARLVALALGVRSVAGGNHGLCTSCVFLSDSALNFVRASVGRVEQLSVFARLWGRCEVRPVTIDRQARDAFMILLLVYADQGLHVLLQMPAVREWPSCVFQCVVLLEVLTKSCFTFSRSSLFFRLTLCSL